MTALSNECQRGGNASWDTQNSGPCDKLVHSHTLTREFCCFTVPLPFHRAVQALQSVAELTLDLVDSGPKQRGQKMRRSQPRDAREGTFMAFNVVTSVSTVQCIGIYCKYCATYRYIL